MTEDELWDALAGLYAYDTGSVDSGIHDEELRIKVKEQMRAMSDDGRRVFLCKRVRDYYLSDKAIAQHYGLEDIASFDNG